MKNENFKRIGGSLASETRDAWMEWGVFLLLLTVGVLGRRYQVEWNVTPTAALALFAGYWFGAGRTAVLVPLSILAISNLWLDNYNNGLELIAVYGCFLVPAMCGRFLRSSGGWLGWGGCAALPSAVFFVVTNGAVWISRRGEAYADSLGGLMDCYAAGLPFYRWMLVGDLAFTAIVFAVYAASGARGAVWSRAMRGAVGGVGLIVLGLGFGARLGSAAELPEPMVKGLKNPESVAVGADGRVYATVIGEFGKDGDGGVMVIEKGQASPFVSGLDDPKGLVTFGQSMFVTDKDRVLRIDAAGKVAVVAAASAFPAPPVFLNDITADEKGVLYVSDSGDFQGEKTAIYKISDKGKVTLVADSKTTPSLKSTNGLVNDSENHLLAVDVLSGDLNRIRIADGTAEKVSEGFLGGDGLAWDRNGRLYISSWVSGKVWVIDRPGEKPVLIAEGFESAADLCLDKSGRQLLVPDMKAGTITALPTGSPEKRVDESPLPLGTEVAFPDLQWSGWEGEQNGRIVPLRPIVLTHAGDKSKRNFVATQQGVIHVFDKDPQAKQTKVFLDIQDKVKYDDRENEEGFLGMAFHPRYAENGEFFVFYTVKQPKHTNVISRFRVSKEDPNRADPASEEEIFRVSHGFWNHDGGTIVFGPDGYLYVVLGDGGFANDPQENGQNLNTVLGKVLRLDVNRKDPGLKYAIPADNPFVGFKDARGEIWCYGLRNPWRIAFDRETGDLWCGDVGQNLWEEINLLTKGGNYGWNRREGLHPFGMKGVGPQKGMIDPIWEYHHDVGKSITGGSVYRGERIPELKGYYLYADYVTNKLWALKYDAKQQRVTENRPIADRGQPILSFGEDEDGEVYLMTYSPTGQGIFRFSRQ